MLLVPAVLAPSAGKHTADVAGLVGKRALRMAKEHATLLVEGDILDAVVEVVGDGAEKARENRATHLGVVGEQRVHDANGHATASLGDLCALEITVFREAVGEGLREAAGAQRATDELRALLIDREATVVVLGAGERRLDAVHAPQANDLLDEIGLAGEVRTRGGRHDLEVIAVLLRNDGAAKALEQVGNLLVGDGGSAHGADAIAAKGDAGGLDGNGIDINAATTDGGATAALEEGGCDVRDLLAVSGVDLALVANGGLTHEVKIAARAGDVALVKAGALEKDVNGGVVNLGVEATHDTGEGDGALAVVGDDGHVARELALLAVERGELLAIASDANNDVTTAVALGELSEVEGVQRLAGEVHHVVGDVHDVVDGTAAGGDDTTREPIRGRADLNATDDTGHVARAELGGVDAHVDEVRGLGALLVLNRGKLDVRVLVENRADLGSHAHIGEAVRAVGRDLAVKDGVGQATVLGEVHAHGGVLGKDHDAGVIATEAELASRAVHATGLHATKLALLDLEITGENRTNHRDDDLVALLEVLGTADDLQRNGVAVRVDVLGANGDLAKPHVVRIRVRLLRDDLANDDMVEIGANALDRLDLGAGADELAVQDLGIGREVDHGAEPLI